MADMKVVSLLALTLLTFSLKLDLLKVEKIAQFVSLKRGGITDEEVQICRRADLLCLTQVETGTKVGEDYAC